MFKCELHCHTDMVSICSIFKPGDIVDSYVNGGYRTIVITDHFSPATFETLSSNYSEEDKVKHFLSGYESVKKLAQKKINVLLGMEFRNIYSSNDYLCYGVTEQFLLDCASKNINLLELHLKDFIELAHKHNITVYQAHPFRDGMTIVKPMYCDGIEILNRNIGHDSRNDIAAAWAKKYGMKGIGGSDAHKPADACLGGIYTEKEIKINEDLIDALRNTPKIIGS